MKKLGMNNPAAVLRLAKTLLEGHRVVIGNSDGLVHVDVYQHGVSQLLGTASD